MTYKAIVTEIKNVRKHPNADRLLLATCWGNQVIVGLNTKEGDLGIYFPTDGQLSKEYAIANDLIRRKNLKTGKLEGGMFDENRRVRTQKFRGEISDGYWAPIESLNWLPDSIENYITKVENGLELDQIDGYELCNKYISKRTKGAMNQQVSTKKRNESVMFKRHFDTKQLGREIETIPLNAHIIITEKVHGTSQRVGHVQVERAHVPKWKEIVAWIFNIKIAKFDWKYLIGTRRVVLDKTYDKGTGFHSDAMRENASIPFINNLYKGETVFYEIVGYDNNTLIMPIGNNDKLGKDFVKKYGKTTTFRYNCNEGEHDIYVYRITMTNEDGQTLDYSWEDVKNRCNDLTVKYVPELYNLRKMAKGNHDRLMKIADRLAEGESSINNSHIKEGVCVRVESGISPMILKHKSFEFKVLEGIIKDSGVVDLEEIS